MMLFSGVEEITVQGPRLIKYTGDARAAFVVPEHSTGLIDKSTDLLPDDLGARELACFVSNISSESGGGLLAYSGFYFADKSFDTNRPFRWRQFQPE
jgi:hypothetical protein